MKMHQKVFYLSLRRVSHLVNTSRATMIEHGLVVIVDISGLTKFVFETALTARRNIVSDLLLFGYQR